MDQLAVTGAGAPSPPLVGDAEAVMHGYDVRRGLDFGDFGSSDDRGRMAIVGMIAAALSGALSATFILVALRMLGVF
jgi:hypothetical protein